MLTSAVVRKMSGEAREFTNEKSTAHGRYSLSFRFLFAQAEAFDEGLVTLDFFITQVGQQAVSRGDHLGQTKARVIIFGVSFQMPGHLGDAFSQERNLDLGGTGIFRVD